MPRIVKTAVVRREELLDAAMGLFATRGYDQTSISEIIAAVGISKGAFYHHYAAKQDLLEALATRYAQEASHRTRDIIEDPSLDAFERLSRFLSRMRDNKLELATRQQLAFAPIFREENVQLYERTRLAVNAVVRPLLRRIIAEGVEEQTFDTSDPEEAADVILEVMASTRQIAAALYAARTPAEVDVATDRLFRRMRFLGTVVDRILGIPEGSIELTDAESLAVIGAVWRDALGTAAGR